MPIKHQKFIDIVSRISKVIQDMTRRSQSASGLARSLDKMAEGRACEMEALK